MVNDQQEYFPDKGCDKCKQGVISGITPPPPPPPRKISQSENGPIFLCICDECKTYWEFGIREAHPITEEEAKNNFPEAFKTD